MMKLLLFFFSCLVAGFAQVETTTSITGNVTDQQGAAFAGAIVKLANQNTGALRETLTNSEGVYSFQSLPAGTYTISVSAKGFKTTTITDRTVETAQPAHVDLKLEVGATSEQITVSVIVLERLDDTQVASVEVGIGKARTAAIFRRPSKVLAKRIATAAETNVPAGRSDHQENRE